MSVFVGDYNGLMCIEMLLLMICEEILMDGIQIAIEITYVDEMMMVFKIDLLDLIHY